MHTDLFSVCLHPEKMDFMRTGGGCFTLHPAPVTLSTVLSTDQVSMCTWMTQVTRDNCLQFASQMITTPGLLKCAHGPGDASALISCPRLDARLPLAQAALGRRSKCPAVGLTSKWGVLPRSWPGNSPTAISSLGQWLSTLLMLWPFNKVNVMMTFNRNFVATS